MKLLMYWELKNLYFVEKFPPGLSEKASGWGSVRQI